MTRKPLQPGSDTSAFESLHRGLTVALIATPRRKLKTCGADERLAAVLERHTEQYDYLPVVEDESEDAAIVGLLNASGFDTGRPVNGTVRERMDGLSESNLIGADASILDFVLGVRSKAFRLTVSGQRISGLVTWADLQHLPVRAALFGVITGFEIIMVDAIRRMCATDDAWLRHLSCGRRKKVKKEIEESHKNDSDVDALLYTQICDKGDILRKRCNLGESMGKLKKQFRDIQGLRDRLAHANQYASTRSNAESVSRTVEKLLELRRRIENLPGHTIDTCGDDSPL